jgi:hypothetical protein
MVMFAKILIIGPLLHNACRIYIMAFDKRQIFRQVTPRRPGS